MKTNKNVVITKDSHSRTSLSGIYNACRCQIKGFPLLNRCVEDAEQKSLSIRLCYKKAFTLIELLVVVLIIGILAAIALPQYQKAVWKSNAMQGLALTKALGTAMESYYYTNNAGPNSLDELEFTLPGDWNGTAHFYGNLAQRAKSNGMWSISLEVYSSGSFAGVNNLYVGFIDGPYRGGGFTYSPTERSSEGRVFCVEVGRHLSYGFQKNEGDFCQQFFQGELVFRTNELRKYKIPA